MGRHKSTSNKQRDEQNLKEEHVYVRSISPYGDLNGDPFPYEDQPSEII